MFFPPSSIDADRCLLNVLRLLPISLGISSVTDVHCQLLDQTHHVGGDIDLGTESPDGAISTKKVAEGLKSGLALASAFGMLEAQPSDTVNVSRQIITPKAGVRAMSSDPEKAGEPTDITLQGLCNQIHAVNEALERALAILHADDPGDNKLDEAVEAIELAREMTSKLDLALFAATIQPDS